MPTMKPSACKTRYETANVWKPGSGNRPGSLGSNSLPHHKITGSSSRAITATAHKLARIIYHIVTTRQDYDETICVQNEVRNRECLEARLRKQARQLGFQLVAAS